MTNWLEGENLSLRIDNRTRHRRSISCRHSSAKDQSYRLRGDARGAAQAPKRRDEDRARHGPVRRHPLFQVRGTALNQPHGKAADEDDWAMRSAAAGTLKPHEPAYLLVGWAARAARHDMFRCRTTRERYQPARWSTSS